ncbi:uncharacterized protein LOC129768095 [Toxorhynchites rutilus septentrionalis]|uniref:uncharacterized protein LOC129768095 n=1 Tax=Toxorhynchites rutilus septentrionalis TaxID=329112 RepID=UPI0024798307|nr:uncharacterized protein LOC129768095 [Toxorhynchites rutilus septentrionalis]XP_055625489.1 uncharacterized protein LOC129768095 [Toxorhynchites rutilus septentrionalis]XP_055625490.1 uncharacterized protein LOC129768095 [Toxorhynchites rutilus septentrionalis]
MGAAKRSRRIPAAKRVAYRRLFRKLCQRYPSASFAKAGNATKGSRNLFCHLMHKRYLKHQLNAHHRNHYLVLDKKVGVPVHSKGTVPAYFRKRILRNRLAEKENSKVDSVGDEKAEPDSETSEEIPPTNGDEDSKVSSKNPEIPDPTKFSVLKGDIEEYCAVQEKVQILISMLKARARELGNDGGEKKEEEEKERHISTMKLEQNECDTAELESLAEKYYVHSDDEDTKDIVESKVEVNDEHKEESKHDILFVDADAFNDSECESSESKPNLFGNHEELLPVKSLKDISPSDLLDPTFSSIKLEPILKTNSVVDALFNKFNLKLPTAAPKDETNPSSENDENIIKRLRDRRKIALKPRYVDEEDEEPKKWRPSRIFDKIHKKLNIDLDCNSNSSTEFYGFDEGEVIKLDKPTVPGLLPTPIVKKSRPNAPFLAHDTTFEDIKIENRDDLFREEGLISFGSLPPRLECPRRPDDMVRPRTVAQKRILLQKKNDVRYLMIDNESKIFNELEKRSKNIDVDLDFDRMKELQDQNIPFTRDTWRALAWLRTEKGKYFFQTMKIDNHSIKLSGCEGNHASKKHAKKQLSAPSSISRKQECRCPEYPSNVTIDLGAIEPQVSIKSEPEECQIFDPALDKKLLRGSSSCLLSTRPGPLSSKLRYDSDLLHRTEDDAYLGPLEILEMPTVEIEVFPRIDRPLDPIVKPYLKMLLPFSGITEKWARFAVSTLKTSDRREEDIPPEERSFSFTLPYSNNQRRILIRRRVVNSCEKQQSEESMDKFEKALREPLTFRKHLDAPDSSGVNEIDPAEKDCADILTEITDAVAISLAEDVFVGRDPDCDYTREDKPLDKPNVVGAESGKPSESAAKCKRMLREMKRLNATIIETIPDSQGEEQKSQCDRRYCSHGCICEVFSGKHTSSAGVARSHCNKIDCIFGCQCGYEKKRTTAMGKELPAALSEEGFSALTKEDVKYLREKATARLAKEERDFTPTVILTNNSTVLVRNTEIEMRRNKKKPKKYDDYYNDSSVKNLLNGVTCDVVEDRRDPSLERVQPCSTIDKPLSLHDRIRHTHVVLNRLDLDHIEPWCMVHCLYRCYCRGNAVAGKPFKFNEESNIVLPAPAIAPEQALLPQNYEPRRRRLYSFEKPECLDEMRIPQRKRDSSEESYKPWNERRKKRRTLEDQHSKSLEQKDSSESLSSSKRTSLEDLQIHDGQTCRRAIPVNRNFYKTRNYYRKDRYQRDIEETKRANPHAEKRLKALLETCERTFFEERKRELEDKAREVREKQIKTQREANAENAGIRQDKQRTKEPIHIDIVEEEEKIRNNPLLGPLVDMSKVLIFCGKKKYYVEHSAIESGKVNLINIAKKFRSTVYVIKRVENDPLAKNIIFGYRNENITLQGRKYSKYQTYKQTDNEHVDLNLVCDGESPESSSSLVQDATPESDTIKKIMLDQVNSDITHTMQHIREMLRKNTTTLNPPKKGILYLFKWEKFLQAFNEDSLDVWDVTFQNGADLVIITTEDTRKNTPTFKDTKSVRFARKSTFETKGASLLTKMLLYQIDNPETNKLSLVLFGTENYWRFCGFIKAGSNYLENGCEVRPTPVSHPKVAPKINKYFEAFVANQVKREAAIRPPAVDNATDGAKPKAKRTDAVEAPKPIRAQKQKEPTQAKQRVALPKMPAIKSNVKLMETKIKDFKNIAIPNVGTRRWFMLNIVNDFSDIYIPSWKSCLTYGRIKQAIQLANRYKKTVKLTSIVLKSNQDDVLPQIYAAPGQGDCIFLGPYTYTQHIDLMLCQNVDGKMYTREEYERNNHIVRLEQTTGSWLYMKPNPAAVPSAPSTSSQIATKAKPPTRTATVSSSDDDCVVIDDANDCLKLKSPTDEHQGLHHPKKEQTSEPSKNNNQQLESLIHQLYDDSDSDECTASETLSAASKSQASDLIDSPSFNKIEETTKNQLSLLVDKTIENSKQLTVPNNSAISNRRMSCIPASNSQVSTAAGKPHLQAKDLPTIHQNTTKPKRKSTGTIEPQVPITNAKKSRLSLPTTAASATEVVCLDDDDDDDDDNGGAAKSTISPSASKMKPPSSTTFLNSQQAALIASKINLLNPNQKGVVMYNPSTGLLRIKRSLMKSLTEGSTVPLPTASSSKSETVNAIPKKATSPGQKLPESTANVRRKNNMDTAAQPPLPQKPVILSSADVQAAPSKPPTVPTEGVLRSNIPGLGLVAVLWSPRDIIIKVRELSVRHQFVRLSNMEAAVVLLNRFIRKNTYTFKPFSLTIGWKFEVRSTPILPEENLINTISLRCVITTDGVVDLYKASAIVAFQHIKPNFYEELLLLRLSILCCKKEQYEQEKCHKFFENIFVKASTTIKELKSASEALTAQSSFLREQLEERKSYLTKLKANLGTRQQQHPSVLRMVSKRVPVPQSILNSALQVSATDTRQKESVIVIDDD